MNDFKKFSLLQYSPTIATNSTAMTTEAKDKTDNELIAEFMGYDVYDYELFGDMTRVYSPKTDDSVQRALSMHHVNQLKYHESWDWLMPVVEKIAKDYCYDVYIMADGFHTNHSCTIGTTTDIYAEAEGSWLLESVYTAVVKFIKFHNSKQAKP